MRAWWRAGQEKVRWWPSWINCGHVGHGGGDFSQVVKPTVEGALVGSSPGVGRESLPMPGGVVPEPWL